MTDTPKGLEDLNSLPVGLALESFMLCCSSLIWAHKMVTARPFPSIDSLHACADSFWDNASYEDKIEAFDGHPRIGNTNLDTSSQLAQWFADEQKNVLSASDSELSALRTKNLEYEQKFGFMFIVHATGKSFSEIDSILSSRLDRSLDEEANEATEQQRLILHARLNRLVGQSRE